MVVLGDESLINGCLPDGTVLSVSAATRFEAFVLVVEDASDDGGPVWMAGMEVLDEILVFFFVPESPVSGLAGSESTLLLMWLSGVSTVADSSADCESTVDGWEPTEGTGASTLSGDFSDSAILNESGS